QHLQTDANAKKWLAVRRVHDCCAQAARVELAHAVGHRPLAGKDHALRGCHYRRVAGNSDRRAWRHMLDRFRDRAQIAHPVIDDRDVSHGKINEAGTRGRAVTCFPYSFPLVDGTSSMRGSSSTAMRNARPNALKAVSAW